MFDYRDVGWARLVLAHGCAPVADLRDVPPPACPGGCEAVELLEGFAADVPGAAAVMVLASVDLTRLCGRGRVLLLEATTRAQSWWAARVEDTLLAVQAECQGRADAVTQLLLDRGVAPERGTEMPDAGREEIAFAQRLSPAAAQGRLDDARSIRNEARCPGLAVMLAEGRTSPAHLRALLNVIDRGGLDLGADPDGQDRLSAAVVSDRLVQRRLEHGTPWQVSSAARAALARYRDPVDADTAKARAKAARDVSLRELPEGMAEIVATMTVEDAAALMTRLQGYVRDRKAVGDTRSSGELRSDALAACGWNGTASHAAPADATAWQGKVGVRLHVAVTLEALLGLSDAPGSLTIPGSRGGSHAGWVTADTVRALLARDGTDWQRFTTDAAGLLMGASRAYPIPAELARLARSRYLRCTFPGCTCHSALTDIDHAVPWTAGGGTNIGNGHPLNRRHHLLKTHHGWHPVIDPDTGHVTWTSPLGQTAVTDPDIHWLPPPDDLAGPRPAPSPPVPRQLEDPPF